MKRASILLSAIGVVLGLVFSLAAPSDGQITETTTADSTSRSQIHLVSVSPWIGPAAVFRAEVDLRDVAGATGVTFTLHQAVNDRAALDRAIAGEQFGATLLRGEAASSGGASGLAASTPATPIVRTWSERRRTRNHRHPPDPSARSRLEDRPSRNRACGRTVGETLHRP